jgi:hypothetical protein
MPQSPFASSDSPRQKWQFSIRGMLIFTASVAIGTSVSQTNISNWLTIFATQRTDFRQPIEIIKTGWGGGMLATLIFWLCLGLAYQIRDLWICLNANPEIDKAQKAGGQIEIVWRAGLVALLIGYASVLFLVDMRILILPESGDHDWRMGSMLREAVLLSLLLILVRSVPAVHRIKLPALVKHLFEGILYGLVVYYLSKTLIFSLVNTAILGIDSSFPAKFSVINPRLYAHTIAIFHRWSLISALSVLVNLFVLRCLARQWSSGIKRRFFWSVLLIVGIANNFAFVIWFITIGYPTICPYLVETGGHVARHSWITLTILTAILTAVPAYRMTTERSVVAEVPAISWRRNPNKYYHEQRLILLLFVAVLLWIMADLYFEAKRNPEFPITEWGNLFFRGRFYRSSWDFIDALFFGIIPVLFLWLSLLLVILHRAFARRFGPNHPPAELPRINRTKFVTIWLATLAFTISGTLTLVWMSFGLWSNPWFCVR